MLKAYDEFRELEKLSKRLQSIHNECRNLEVDSVTLDEYGIGIVSEGTECGDVSLNESSVGEGPESDIPDILELIFCDLSNK